MKESYFRNLLYAFIAQPSVTNFKNLREAFGRLVLAIQQSNDFAEQLDSQCLIGFLFSKIGTYKGQSPANYFITKLLYHLRDLHRLET